MIERSLIEHYKYSSAISTPTPNKQTLLFQRQSAHQLLPERIVIKRYDFSGVNLKRQRLIGGMKELRGRWDSYNFAMQFYLEKDTFVTAEEHFDNLTLDAIINQDWEIDLSFMATIAEAVQDLHERGLTHGNIKPENVILMQDPLKIKLTDAKTHYLRYLITKKEGRADKINYYAAPDISNEQMIARAADIRALGIVFFEMITHRRIHEYAHRFKEGGKFSIELLNEVKCNHMKKLLGEMLQPNYFRRKTISEVINFLKESTYIEDALDCVEPSQKFVDRELIFPLIANARNHLGPYTLDEREGRSNRLLTISRQATPFKVTFKYNQMEGLLIIRIRKDIQPFSYIYARFRYEDLPDDIRKRYTSCYQLFKVIVLSRNQDYSLSTAGELMLRVREESNEKDIVAEDNKKVIEDTKTNKSNVAPDSSAIEIQLNKKESQIQSSVLSTDKITDKTINILEGSDAQCWINKQIKQATVSLLYFRQKVSSFLKINPEIEEQVWIIDHEQNLTLISLILEKIGSLYAKANSYKQAVTSYELARKGYIESFGENSPQEIALISNLALLMFQQEQYSCCLHLVHKSMEMAQQKGLLEDTQTVKAYILLARTQAKMENISSARSTFTKAMRLANSLNEKKVILYALGAVAGFQFEVKEYQKAEILWSDCVKRIESAKDEVQVIQKATVYYNLATVQLYAGEIGLSLSNFCIALKLRRNQSLLQSVVTNLTAKVTKQQVSTCIPLLQELLSCIPEPHKQKLTNMLLK